MPTSDPARRRHRVVRDLDARLVTLMREVRILGFLSWPARTIEEFLSAYRRGDVRLPRVEELGEPSGLRDTCAALRDVERECDAQDPLQRFIARTAASFSTAGEMLRERGTPGFVTRSAALYGRPLDRMPGSAITHLQAATTLLSTTSDLVAVGVTREEDLCLLPSHVAEEIRKRVQPILGADTPAFVVDPDLAAKAAASASTVRLRGGTSFRRVDVDQLTQHEALVHSLTAINGQRQPMLSCMGAGSPRSTLTQEGLATVAELTTGSMDIARLRRLALRISATDLALGGADFIEVFQFFCDQGQSDSESAHSTARVFRGGDVRGGIAFTKDVVYLCGMVAVHTFLHKAIGNARVELVRRIFCGRMALEDLVDLAPAFDSGEIIEPTYVPPWAADLDRLAAYLAFSSVINRIDLHAIDLEEFLSRPTSGAGAIPRQNEVR